MWSLVALDKCGVRLGYDAEDHFGCYYLLSGMTLDTSLVFCMCDRDCEVMVNTLPPHRVAEVFLIVEGEGSPQTAIPLSQAKADEAESDKDGDVMNIVESVNTDAVEQDRGENVDMHPS